MLEYEKHVHIMQRLFYLSKKIGKYEVPISSVITLGEKIIGIGYNKMISLSNPNNHAEIMALRNARKNINNFFLSNCSIYITQEPCIMCIESITNHKIRKIIYGSNCSKKNRINYMKYLVQRGELDIVINIKEKKCRNIINTFFFDKR